MHDIKVCLIYCPIIIKSTYLHQHFLRISTMLFNISSHLSLKKSTSITIELQIQNKTEKSQFKFSLKKYWTTLKQKLREVGFFFIIQALKSHILCNLGISFLVPYTKDFGRITQFWGNDLATVQSAALYLELLSSNSFPCTKIIE